MGKNNAKLHAAFDDLVESSWDVALRKRPSKPTIGLPGDTALLSPCASFDLFGSYEQRDALIGCPSTWISPLK